MKIEGKIMFTKVRFVALAIGLGAIALAIGWVSLEDYQKARLTGAIAHSTEGNGEERP